MTELFEGLVISHLGKAISVEVSETIFLCQTRRHLGAVAVGDRVMISKSSLNQGCIEKFLPRRSLLRRPDRRNKTRPVVANIDRIYVVFAAEPRSDFLLIDQYLAICENKNIDAVLVFNKIDLKCPEIMESEVQNYQKLGYKVHKVSATQNRGMAELAIELKQHISIFTGQSGVGKSSLTNVLISDKKLKTNAISKTSKHGRHTTTATTLYHLPNGGALIDSPGVAIFGLADLTTQQLAWGYREFQALLEQCQFNNCRHKTDQGCAVRKAAEIGDIPRQRYQRYLKLTEKYLAT